MYQKIPSNPRNGEEAQCIKRLSDNAFIPFDPVNTDYQEYLKWLDAGNTPLLAEGNAPILADDNN
jgi:hypothetical protein